MEKSATVFIISASGISRKVINDRFLLHSTLVYDLHFMLILSTMLPLFTAATLSESALHQC